jgi:hypothetical protein
MTDWAAILPEGTTVEINEGPCGEGWRTIAALVKAPSRSDAMIGVLAVFSTLTAGNATIIRVAPEAESRRNYEAGEMEHRGYVRFMVGPEPGRWSAMHAGDLAIMGFGT